jgi:hypothetical protein
MSTPGTPTDYHTRPYRLTDGEYSPGDSVDFLSEPGIYAVITCISACLVGSTYGQLNFSINAHQFWTAELTIPTTGVQSSLWNGWLPWDENEHFQIAAPIGSGATASFFVGGFYYTP